MKNSHDAASEWKIAGIIGVATLLAIATVLALPDSPLDSYTSPMVSLVGNAVGGFFLFWGYALGLQLLIKNVEAVRVDG